jgi:hypothetical protein
MRLGKWLSLLILSESLEVKCALFLCWSMDRVVGNVSTAVELSFPLKFYFCWPTLVAIQNIAGVKGKCASNLEKNDKQEKCRGMRGLT